jgi:mono/diheme cytochrome c family protein
MTRSITLVLMLGAVTLPPRSLAQPARSVKDGVFTATQQKRGEAIYARECSTCHGETLKGGEGSPALTGPDFRAIWDGKTVADLFDKTRLTMPSAPETPGKLSRQQYVDVIAHILSVNRFPAGSTELPPDSEKLKQIRISTKQ